jgi:hypothetical protein
VTIASVAGTKKQAINLPFLSNQKRRLKSADTVGISAPLPYDNHIMFTAPKKHKKSDITHKKSDIEFNCIRL